MVCVGVVVEGDDNVCGYGVVWVMVSVGNGVCG